ncbi:OmpW family outer membrane protein [Croceicoccus sp. BE223]|uniref:OmpW/AlkL family protein n=1 Tax=Croceicoccus sp. BE223 TaxID=2817716 RepID=UPI002866EBA2|nr:OmpW family outer membrane protein [Croceicoccus sp. BE223]MDR7101021.1 outer membrane protein [Croceicoccus sp. BE223]
MKTQFAIAAALAALSTTPASAQDAGNQGRWQVKALATAVLPDGKITRVDEDIVGLPATLQTRANDNVVPTLAVEYFLADSVSVETICCITQHDVDATTGLPGAELVADAKVIPATVTVKYHVPMGPVKPYVGVGPAYFLWIDAKPGAATVPLGVTKTTLSDELGLAVQAGVDVAVNDSGLGVTLDAKRYFIDTTARWYAGSTLAIETRHKLDPWVLSAGLAWRF